MAPGDEGSIVVLEAKTGRVLTWAYTPSFDVTELLTAYAAENHNTTTWENIVENTLHSETYPMLHRVCRAVYLRFCQYWYY
mgnify:FL=1